MVSLGNASVSKSEGEFEDEAGNDRGTKCFVLVDKLIRAVGELERLAEVSVSRRE